MKKKIFITALAISILIGEAACFNPAVAAKTTRKQKKEASYLEVAAASFESKQYDTAIEYYTKAIELNPRNAETYTKEEMLNTYQDISKMQLKIILKH